MPCPEMLQNKRDTSSVLLNSKLCTRLYYILPEQFSIYVTIQCVWIIHINGGEGLTSQRYVKKRDHVQQGSQIIVNINCDDSKVPDLLV